MDLNHFTPHIPEIERRIRNLRPDALVVGLGPSARLLPLLDPALLAGVRTFGVNDVFRFFPVADLVVVDGPWRNTMRPETDRHQHILKSTPERFWIWEKAFLGYEQHGRWNNGWTAYLSPQLKEKVRVTPMTILQYYEHRKVNREPEPGSAPADHMHGTPTVATSIAWLEGCRRIGVLGVDITRDHVLWAHLPGVQWFYKHFSRKAHALGGAVWNLSPISNVRKFDPGDAERAAARKGAACV